MLVYDVSLSEEYCTEIASSPPLILLCVFTFNPYLESDDGLFSVFMSSTTCNGIQEGKGDNS